MQSVQTYDVNSFHSSQVNLNYRKSREQKVNLDLIATARLSVLDIGVDSARKEDENQPQGRSSIFSFGDMNEKLNEFSPNK